MKKNILLLFFIFFLGFILRFWHLGINPPSLDWDEASLGYNAYSILKTGRDEYGNFLPLSFRSFGDYKPPLYVYLSAIPISLFGLNEFSTRFISMLFGSLSVVVAYFLVREMFKSKPKWFYLIFTIFFAISPWHIQFSRVAFEANLALFFAISGLVLFMKGLKHSHFYIFSFLSFVLSTYAYHSERLFIPLLILFLTVVYFKEIKKNALYFSAGLIIFLILFFPQALQLREETSARFGSVTVLNPDERLADSIKAIEYDRSRADFLGSLMHNRRIVYGREILKGYLDHFNFDFLFLTGDPPGRHHAAGMGMLYYWEFPFIIIGIFYALSQRSRGILVLFGWYLTAPLASSFTTGTPHAVRALIYLPAYQMFTALGIFSLAKWSNIRSRLHLNNSIWMVVWAVVILNFFYYLHMYYIHTPQEESKQWQYGYKQAVAAVNSLADNNQKVVVTYVYDQPHIYFLFYNRIDPSWYQQNWGGGAVERARRSFGQYEFRNIDWEKDKDTKNVIFVSAPAEIPAGINGFRKDIRFLDGSVALQIYAR